MACLKGEVAPSVDDPIRRRHLCASVAAPIARVKAAIIQRVLNIDLAHFTLDRLIRILDNLIVPIKLAVNRTEEPT